MIGRIILVSVLLTAAALRAQTPPATQASLEAKKQVFDANTGEYFLTGEARLEDVGTLLLADEIVYNTKTNVATAIGHISFTRADVRLLADRLVYNRTDGTFTAENIRLGSHPYFIEGFSASGTPHEITVRRARASYGEPGPWQPTINADTIIYSPGQQLRTENVTVGIGHTQPVPIPRFDYKLGAPLIGTVNLTGGFRRSLGLFADGTLHVPVAPGLRLGADLGLFTSRGLMAGPSGRYFDFEDPDQLHGFFRSGYINDYGERGTDLLGRPIPKDRAYAEWQHQQVLAPNLTLAAQLNWWKDSEVVRDFHPRAFFPVQQPDTFVETVYTGPNYFISAFARFQPNTFHRVQQRLPEVRFDLLPTPIGRGFIERFEASAAVLREHPPGENVPNFALSATTGALIPFTTPLPSQKQQSNRFDAYYALERPFAPADWFTFTPVAGGRVTHYDDSRRTLIALNPSIPASFTAGQARLGDYTRLLGEVGADAALRTSGTFDYQNPQWKIDGLRHLVTPRLSYRYIPQADKGGAHIAAIDRDVFSTYLQPLGLGDPRNVDTLHATNTLRFALDQILQTRDRTEGTRDLASLNTALDFRFERRAPQRDVSLLHNELAVMPARWLQFDLYSSVAPKSVTLRELNTGLTLRDGTAWSLRFGNNLLRTDAEDFLLTTSAFGRPTTVPILDYSLDARARINERFEARTRLHYDARKHRFNEQAYGITQNLGNTWLISYTVTLYSGRRRESSFGFNVQIDTVRF